jgi:H+-transporting ATPase
VSKGRTPWVVWNRPTQSYDNAPVALRPVKWDMERVLTVASTLGIYGVLESFVLYWLARNYFVTSAAALQAVIFLKLLVSGHMTIYLTRNKGWVWQRPLPSSKLVVPCELTQFVGTLIVVYGIAMAPTGWRLALLVWSYSIVSFFVANAVKVGTYRLIGYLTPWHMRHFARVEGHVTRWPGTSPR